MSKNFFEKDAWATDRLVCGIDEVGRGCLAGPVLVAALVLEPHASHTLLRDSKVMTAQQREIAFQWIIKHSTYAIATVDNHVIDTINIYQATMKAMQEAYARLAVQLQPTINRLKYVAVDAMPLVIPHPGVGLDLEVCYFNKGESFSTSIAAASIVAKVTRDRLMEELDQQFPAYGFAQHKGYATREHIDAIARFGPTVLHRRTFLKMFDQQVCTGQQSIF